MGRFLLSIVFREQGALLSSLICMISKSISRIVQFSFLTFKGNPREGMNDKHIKTFGTNMEVEYHLAIQSK